MVDRLMCEQILEENATSYCTTRLELRGSASEVIEGEESDSRGETTKIWIRPLAWAPSNLMVIDWDQGEDGSAE